MPRWVVVRNRSRSGLTVARARWCSSFLCKLRGLSLRRSLPAETGLMLVESRDGRWITSIHMFGMLFAIGVVWIDGRGTVVDIRRAFPWRVYLPAAPARFTLEGSLEILERAAVGEVLEFAEDSNA
jgi:uncharacterized membrane protein (UPF0127 family)